MIELDIPTLAKAMEEVNRAGGAQPFVIRDGGSWHDWEEHARRIILQANGYDWANSDESV